MEIRTIVTKQMDQNCYLIYEGVKGILIDPGLDTLKILKETEGIEINYILLTHCHFDHVHSVNELRKGKICVSSKKCSDNVMSLNISLLSPETLLKAPCDIILEDGEEKDFDGIKVKCIHTPGHTNGSVCYLIGDKLFTGDTLFYRSIGRTDLPTGSFLELESSIKNKIYTLDENIKVYPGHGPCTTIGFEKKNNGYITE